MINPQAATSVAVVRLPIAFTKALGVLKKSVYPKASLPILRSVLLSFDGEALSATTTDLEIRTTYRTAVEALGPCEPFSTTVEFASLASSLAPNADAVLTVDAGSTVTIEAAGARTTLCTLPAGDFPSDTTLDGTHGSIAAEATFDMRSFTETIGTVAQFAARESGRGAVMCGVLGQLRGPDNPGIALAATDAFVLAQRFLPAVSIGAACTSLVPISFIMPGSFARLISSIKPLNKKTPDDDSTLRVVVGRNHAWVNALGFTSRVRLVDGEYPDIQKVLPAVRGPVLRVDRVAYLAAVEAAADFSASRDNEIRISIGGSEVLVTAEDELRGSFIRSLPANSTYIEPFTAAFNGKRLARALKSFRSATVEIDQDYRHPQPRDTGRRPGVACITAGGEPAIAALMPLNK